MYYCVETTLADNAHSSDNLCLEGISRNIALRDDRLSYNLCTFHALSVRMWNIATAEPTF